MSNQQSLALLRLLMQAGQGQAGARSQSGNASVEAPPPGSFSFQGRNYKIGDEFQGAKILDAQAIKGPDQIPAGFKLVDEKGTEINRPQEIRGVAIGSGTNADVVEFNPANEEHVRLKAQQDAEFKKQQESFDKAWSSPNRRFVQTEKTGKRDYKDTYYVEREGALIPVGSQTRYQPSGWVSFRDQALKPAAMIALSSFGAPAIAGALGGGALGTIGAGAAVSGASTAIAGGSSSEIFRNALIGGATAGLTRVANPAIKAALGGTEVAGGVANAATSAGVAAIRGGDPVQAALMGGLRGVSPESARVLRTVMQINQLQQRASAQPRPQPRPQPRRG